MYSAEYMLITLTNDSGKSFITSLCLYVPICKMVIIKILMYIFRVLCKVGLTTPMSANDVITAARDRHHCIL